MRLRALTRPAPFILMCATLLLPSAHALTSVSACNTSASPTYVDLCDVIAEGTSARCLVVNVTSVSGEFVTPPAGNCRARYELLLVVDGASARGHIHSAMDDVQNAQNATTALPSAPPAPDTPGTPPPTVPDVPSVPTTASEEASTDVSFEVRYHPCGPTLVHVHAATSASGPIADPTALRGMDAERNLPDVCSLAARLASGDLANDPDPYVLLARLVMANAPVAGEPASLPAVSPDRPTTPGPPARTTTASAMTSSPPIAVVPESSCVCVSVEMTARAATRGNTSMHGDASTHLPPIAAPAGAGSTQARSTNSPPPGRVDPDERGLSRVAAQRSASPKQDFVAAAHPSPRDDLPHDDGGRAVSPPGSEAVSTSSHVTRPPPRTILTAAVGGLALELLVGCLIPGYSRIMRDRVLDHPQRCKVYEAARERRVVTAAEVARGLSMDVGTVRYHLETLSKCGMLTATRTSMGSSYHLPEARDEAAAARKEPLSDRIARAVTARPGVNMSELARELGVSKRAAQNHVLDLLARGTLMHRRENGARQLYPSVATGSLIPATTRVETP